MYVIGWTFMVLVLIHVHVAKPEVEISNEMPNDVYIGFKNTSKDEPQSSKVYLVDRDNLYTSKDEPQSPKAYLVDLDNLFKTQSKDGPFCGLPPPECEFPLRFGPQKLYGCSDMGSGDCQCLTKEDKNSENFRILNCKAPSEICKDGEHKSFDYKKLDSKHVVAAKPPKCNILRRGVTQQKKYEIVKIHNDYRAKLARGGEPNLPKGSNIRELRWNDELAFVAQKLADRCDIYRRQVKFNKHSERFITRRALCSRFYKPSHSFYFEFKTYYSKNDNWKTAFENWHLGGGYHMTYGPFRGKRIDSVVQAYTQMIWAQSYEIGCGVALHHMGMFNTNYVCYYGPGGNVIGELPYKAGEPATECGMLGKSPNYPELCA